MKTEYKIFEMSNNPVLQISEIGCCEEKTDRLLGVEIEEAIRELGDDYTAHQVMHKLKSYAGKAGSCIQDTGSDFVIWRNKDNEIAKLNTSALRKRLGRKNGRR